MTKTKTLTPDLIDQLSKSLDGNLKHDSQTLDFYSHDTSIFEIKPELVVFPKNVKDLKTLVAFVNQHVKKYPSLSLTPRSGGSDMSGGAVNDSIIVDDSKYMNKVGTVKQNGTWVEPGAFYRDFEPKTLKKKLVFPSYPASRNLAALGGIVANNAGGEKSLKYGKTIDYVVQLKVVLADGNEYLFKKITLDALKQKIKLKTFEGQVYKKTYKLIKDNFDFIRSKKPAVTKNSTGYNLWDVFDGKHFDLTKLFVGSQGTIGLITDIKMRLVPTKSEYGLLAIYLDDIDQVPELINAVMVSDPDTFEVFDDHTMKLALRFMPQFIRILGLSETIAMGFQFGPLLAGFLFGGIPKFTFLVEYEANSQEEIDQQIDDLAAKIEKLGLKTTKAKQAAAANRYKAIRRESFNLLRKNVRDKHSAAFIDDFIITPSTLPEFFPKLVKLLNKYNLLFTVAGHMGNGNFHIIPLMDLSTESERKKIFKAAKEVNQLVLDYEGSLSAEHNEGLVRGPFIKQMYGPKMFNIFKQVEHIFDPNDIFNPHKKTGATVEFAQKHIRHKYE